jgi:hypothetical protein
VFLFSLQSFSETFLILGSIERDIIKMYIGLHVKYPPFLSGFNKTRIFSTDFRKITRHKFYGKPSIRIRVVPYGRKDGRTDGRTDGAI